MRKVEQNTLMAFLGAGGQNPRVDIIDTESLEILTSMILPPMQSAYAIDVDWHRERVFVGTKGGYLYNIDNFLEKDFNKNLPSRTMYQGAPVLSVSHVGSSNLVVSDIAGRCLFWKTETEPLPIPLETRGEVVCSILALDREQVVGLSYDGVFFNWDLSGADLIHTKHLPHPPPIGGFVQMVFWQAAQAIVYPGRNGNLVLYDPEKDTKREIKAHNGMFYAVGLLDEAVLTIGMEDRDLKLWMPDSKQAFFGMNVPDEILSVSHFGGLKRKILLIGANGKAQTYFLDEDQLVFDQHLVGKDYRVSISPPSQMIDAYNEMRKEQEAHELWVDLKNPSRSDPQAIDMHLSRLGELGFKHVTLAIQADKMEKEGNVTECLRLRSALAQMLPEHPAACPSFERYAVSLEKLWLLPEAENICKSILGIDQNYHFSLDFDRISRIVELMKTSQWTIEPDIPIKNIIDACNVLGKIFFGRYLIKKLNSFYSRRTILNSKTIIDKYQEIRRKSRRERLPTAESENHWWISPTGTYEIELVMFGKAPFKDLKGLRFALQIFPHAQGTVVVPVVLFDWQIYNPVSTAKESNKMASIVLDRFTNDASSSYVREIHRVAHHALRRLITKDS